MSEKHGAVRADLARRLREARGRAGLSQGQVASLLGIHRPAISKIEGCTRNVLAEELARFADLYDVSVEWLLGRVDDEDVVARLAARGLDKLKAEDRKKLLALLSSLPEVLRPAPATGGDCGGEA